MNILLFSKDIFLTKTLESRFGEIDFEVKKGHREYAIVIFDDCDKNFIEEYTANLVGADLDSYLIINIGSKQVDNVTNITIPFKINSLIDKISEFTNYYKKYIVEYGGGILNLNKKTFSFKNNIIYFTNKEIELIDFLLKNDKVDKQTLLDRVWNIKIFNDKVVETAIYNIRQKFKNINFENFILCENGIYSILKIT
jgi:two-component SAPR family response regulator